MSSTVEHPDSAACEQVELAIGGMTCASCANRIERKLNKLDGVSASVNYATEKARVSYPAGVSSEELVATMQAAGYRADPPAPPDARPQQQPGDGQRDDEDGETASLRQRLLVSLALAVPVVVLAMVPAAQFTYWQWLSLTLAAPNRGGTRSRCQDSSRSEVSRSVAKAFAV